MCDISAMDSPPPTVVKTSPVLCKPTTGVAGETNEFNDPAQNLWTAESRGRQGLDETSRAATHSTGSLPQNGVQVRGAVSMSERTEFVVNNFAEMNEYSEPDIPSDVESLLMKLKVQLRTNSKSNTERSVTPDDITATNMPHSVRINEAGGSCHNDNEARKIEVTCIESTRDDGDCRSEMLHDHDLLQSFGNLKTDNSPAPMMECQISTDDANDRENKPVAYEHKKSAQVLHQAERDRLF